MIKAIHLTLLALFFSITLSAQHQHDFSTFDGVVNATYHLLSGPAGERDWETFKSLFHESGNMGATILDKEGKRKFYGFTVEQYILNNDAFLKKSDFYEEEIGRQEMVFGGIAQIYSAFQYKFSKNGKIEARGINCIQLIKEKGRWWITNLIWEDETEKIRIPNNLLKG